MQRWAKNGSREHKSCKYDLICYFYGFLNYLDYLVSKQFFFSYLDMFYIRNQLFDLQVFFLLIRLNHSLDIEIVHRNC